MNCRERKEAFMELELKKACLDAYETGGELVLTQEETAETIVPDYCPDIARVIETEAKCTYTAGSCGTERQRYPALYG